MLRLPISSLALSVAISMTAMTAKLWLVNYMGRVNAPGSAYDRAMRRQEAFSGLQAWKVDTIIDSLPLFTLVSVTLFGLFILSAVGVDQPALGFFVTVIFLIGLTFILMTSFSAAFIPSSPLQSPFSEFIAFVCRVIFPRNDSKWRPVVVLIVSVTIAGATAALVVFKHGAFQAFIYFPIAGVWAVARTPKRSSNYSPICGLPQFFLFSGISVFIAMAFASYFHNRTPTYVALTSAACVLFILEGCFVRKLTEFAPDTQEAEAVAWLLGSSPSQKSSWFRNAGQIAGTEQKRAILLKAVLPLLPPLISSRLRRAHSEPQRDELKAYLSCLALLSEFHDSKRSVWNNRAAIEYPTFPFALLLQLDALSKSSDPYLRETAESVLCSYREARMTDENVEKSLETHTEVA